MKKLTDLPLQRDGTFAYALDPILGVNSFDFSVGRGYTCGAKDRRITTDEAVDIARRLVACWNACDGISTETLERSELLAGLIQQRSQLTSQRDELLALSKNFEITGPDADDFVWLVLHGNGTTGRAAFCLGKPEHVAHVCRAFILKATRSAA